MLELFQTVTLS